MIGNMCKLDLDEWAMCGNDVLLGRFRIFTELNDGDVFADSGSFPCVAISGAFNTLNTYKKTSKLSAKSWT